MASPGIRTFKSKSAQPLNKIPSFTRPPGIKGELFRFDDISVERLDSLLEQLSNQEPAREFNTPGRVPKMTRTFFKVIRWPWRFD
jgi:hypothetical protein